jgi:hypothetical protein
MINIDCITSYTQIAEKVTFCLRKAKFLGNFVAYLENDVFFVTYLEKMMIFFAFNNGAH